MFGLAASRSSLILSRESASSLGFDLAGLDVVDNEEESVSLLMDTLRVSVGSFLSWVLGVSLCLLALLAAFLAAVGVGVVVVDSLLASSGRRLVLEGGRPIDLDFRSALVLRGVVLLGGGFSLFDDWERLLAAVAVVVVVVVVEEVALAGVEPGVDTRLFFLSGLVGVVGFLRLRSFLGLASAVVVVGAGESVLKVDVNLNTGMRLTSEFD